MDAASRERKFLRFIEGEYSASSNLAQVERWSRWRDSNPSLIGA